MMIRQNKQWNDDWNASADSAEANEPHLTLYELNNLVAQTLAVDMPDEYWVEAELSELREVRGHCYMELVQKDEVQNVPVARASAKCWHNRWAFIRPAFERATGQMLHAGMKVLLRVYANFHEAYGFSWIVTDINPEFTLGDLARHRRDIVRQLKAEGVFDLQRELSLPMFAQRIAVVSSGGAAGYGDFCNQLSNNSAGYAFTTTLFPAVMQGNGVEQSIIAALNDIYDNIDKFDAVVIIRGGGSTSDLSGFDTLALAENVANFPLPIITGIGHERDESVLDMVSHTRVKTPTAAAAFLIDNLSVVDVRLGQLRDAAIKCTTAYIDAQKSRLVRMAEKVPMLFSLGKTREEAHVGMLLSRLRHAATKGMAEQDIRIESLSEHLNMGLERALTAERHRIEMLQQRVAALDPAVVLRRGYSITMHDGHAVRDPKALPKGTVVETIVEKGKFKSVVK